ncbi:DNA ligase I, ATP-dependent Dnl1 [Thermocrinis albus DSM 14484]|uniref:Probable DNA ligase n=1 Tax=Thermocrinis albus (strain DSM 14484 / JCM 11386 / HI 11/12) TaxID=638303 RepID=D3SP22_THEAH|nr:ATP-dependent DNA ligase [Thermocrinis albus]ADC88909.1 DNA ligase I, ATP-dependent Dnl1 [Thermocrinis albus DSM 14484]
MKFIELAQYFKELENTTSRLHMADILYRLLKSCSGEEVDKVIYLTLGELLPPFTGVEMGISEKLSLEAISKATGTKLSQVESIYRQTGDIGETAATLIKWEGKGLSVVQVYDELLKIAKTRGTLDKLMALISLLRGLSPLCAKYVMRIVVGRLRLGVGEATLLDALAMLAGNRNWRQDIERAYNLCSDLGLVARTLLEKGIEGVKGMKLQVGYPVRMALAERVSSAEEIIKRLGKCAVEAKYDGLRLQIHKSKDRVEIYSRNLERMTEMFPDITSAVLSALAHVEDIIFEGEAISYDEETGEFHPFQITIQRKRKYGVYQYSKEYPLKLFSFDLLYVNGNDMTEEPFIERRRTLENLLSGKQDTILLSEMRIVETAKEIEEFFQDAVSRGLEGIMAKRLDAPYTAGSRNFNWIKLKRSYRGALTDTVDVVIVGYFYGKGARAKLGIGALLTAVYDPSTDTFKTISKVGSGFTEDEWIRLKNLLDEIKLPHRHARVDSILEADVWVEPKYVVTVTADEITRSPLHTAGRTITEPGYALRFPRAVGFIRIDKKPEDATTVEEILRLYQLQRKVSTEGET